MKYLYNGVELPALPESQNIIFPYMDIIAPQSNDSQYTLTACSVPKYYDSESDGCFVQDEGARITFVPSSNLENWEEYVRSAVAGDGYYTSFWSSYDILNADGTVYLAATDPIPVSGSAAYSYNGAELPSLPEIPKIDLPYAAIVKTTDDSYRVYFTSEAKKAARGQLLIIGSFDKAYELIDGVWVETTEDCVFLPAVWSNYDIYNSDDTLYLAASDPIPVGSAHSKFDFYSWLTGYFLSIYGGFKK